MNIDLNKLIELYGIRGLFLALLIMVGSGILKSKLIGDIWTKISDKLIEWFHNIYLPRTYDRIYGMMSEIIKNNKL